MAKHRYTETSDVGYVGNMKNAIGGVIVGIVMAFGAIPLTWWNEGRTVRETRSLEEGQKAVVAAGVESVDAANEGRLVHVAGRLVSDETLADERFGVESSGLRLERTVEMYQWDEDKDEKKSDSGKTTTTYEYDTKWSERAIDSSDFRHRDGHENPSDWPVRSETWRAAQGNLGAYVLDADMLSRAEGNAALEPPAEAETTLDGFRREGSGWYFGENASSPQVGDIRVRFSETPEGDYSFIARQAGSGLAPYATKAGNEILLVDTGIVPAEKMFEAAHSRNAFIAWALRAGGFVLLWLGLSLVMRPLAAATSILPGIGWIVARGIGLVSFVIALLVSLSTIGLAWVWYRPLLGGALLAAAVASIFLLKRKRDVPAVAVVSAPPPPPPPARPA